jgi:hypothetical protein
MPELVVTTATKKCRCGHARDHEHVAQEPEFTFWGWILLSILGISPKPDHIVFRCTKCGDKLGISRDKALIDRKISAGAR